MGQWKYVEVKNFPIYGTNVHLYTQSHKNTTYRITQYGTTTHNDRTYYASVDMWQRHMVVGLRVYLCICMSVALISQRLLKSKSWQMQYRNSANLIILNNLKKGLVCSLFYSVTPQTPLWHIPDCSQKIAADLLVTWNLDQYNGYSCWQQNYMYTVNNLS